MSFLFFICVYRQKLHKIFYHFEMSKQFPPICIKCQPTFTAVYTTLKNYCFILYLVFFLSPGARHDTRKAIERALCVPHDFHCVHLQMKKLREKLDGSMQIASQIYYNPRIINTVWKIQSSNAIKRNIWQITLDINSNSSQYPVVFLCFFHRNESEWVLY